jgi:hypothetical protein
MTWYLGILRAYPYYKIEVRSESDQISIQPPLSRPMGISCKLTLIPPSQLSSWGEVVTNVIENLPMECAERRFSKVKLIIHMIN